MYITLNSIEKELYETYMNKISVLISTINLNSFLFLLRFRLQTTCYGQKLFQSNIVQ